MAWRFAIASGEGAVLYGCLLFIIGTLILAGWPAKIRALGLPARTALGTMFTFYGLYIGFGG